MSAQLVFSFPFNASHEQVMSAINAHFLPNRLPDADNPAAGSVTTAQQAFGNPSEAQQAFGGVQTGAVVAASPNALMGNSSISAHTHQGHAATGANAADAHSGNVTHSSPAGSATASQYDKEGRPWDARIDSNPPTITAKGEWRKRKNVDDTLYANVCAELRQAGKYGTPGGTTAATPQTETFTATKFQGLRNLQAHELAIQQIGKIPFDDETSVRLISGPMGSVTLDATCADWYVRYNAAYNEARARLGVGDATAGAPTLQPVGAVQQPALPMMPALPATQPLSEHAKFVLWVAGEVSGGRLTEQTVTQVLAQCKVVDDKGNGSVRELANFPDFIPQVKQYLIANFGAQA